MFFRVETRSWTLMPVDVRALALPKLWLSAEPAPSSGCLLNPLLMSRVRDVSKSKEEIVPGNCYGDDGAEAVN
jgi:hypothetical protein